MEIVRLTKEQIISAFETAGIKSTKIESMKFEAEETPLRGTIQSLDPKPREYRGNKYMVFIITDNSGKKLGELSVNRCFDTYVIENDFVICKSERNAGKTMLRSHKMNKLSQFGKSQFEIIENLIGKKYTAERQTKLVIDKYEEMFRGDDGEITDEQKVELNKNTVPKELVFFKKFE